jgi:hypothetical protein
LERSFVIIANYPQLVWICGHEVNKDRAPEDSYWQQIRNALNALQT